MQRIGIGFDIHKFEVGRALIIGGVQIPYEKGLAGHSDADVLTHAVMDAILGALGKGDIGVHFPPSDVKYRDANSLALLSHVTNLMQREGYSIVNIDAVVAAERPKMSAYREEMAKNLANAMRIPPSNVSVKFTTTEGLGLEGRGEGISARAVVLLMHTGNAGLC